jgi:acyl-CoA reductase-like NAD-dependent aldehyde dehydrogenase
LGPLAMVESFKYQLDAIKLVNNSPFGQIAYLFHADLEKASKIAVRLEAGRVVVNPTGEGSELSRPSLDESIGGLKSSGFGREGGQASLDFFSRQTAIEGTRLT